LELLKKNCYFLLGKLRYEGLVSVDEIVDGAREIESLLDFLGNILPGHRWIELSEFVDMLVDLVLLDFFLHLN
jgi:hypothetical protein